jgi:enoyl-CoA hydratase/carnithine racemase
MSTPRISYQVENGIAQVKLSRAEKHNALDMPMFYAIENTIKQIKKNRKVRVVIVSGEGASFCSGLDVKSVMQNKLSALKLLWKWWPRQANLAQKITIGWRRLKVPVIMVLHGKCWGGGMQVALGGDFRIAHPETSLAIMEARWGLIPDMGGTPALLENMALDQALQLAMLADPITSKQALENNLITQIDNDPMKAAIVLAEALKQRSPDTNAKIKHLYHQVWSRHAGKILAGETINQWKIIFGKNRQIAIKRALGKTDIDYL